MRQISGNELVSGQGSAKARDSTPNFHVNLSTT